MLNHSAAFFNCQDKISFSAVDLNPLQNQINDSGKLSHANQYLVKSELKTFFSYTFPKRQVEWLGGRIAAKNAANTLLPELNRNWLDITIQPDESGRPYLYSNLDTPIPDISITHSGSQAAALAVIDSLCGLDLQKINATAHKVKKRFCSLSEEQLLKQHLGNTYHQNQQFTALWTAKEAVRKAIPLKPLMGFMEIELKEINPFNNSSFLATFVCMRKNAEQEVKTVLSSWQDYAWALTIIPSTNWKETTGNNTGK